MMIEHQQMLQQSISSNLKKVRQMNDHKAPQCEDVNILTTEPIRRLTPGKMIVINLPGNATSLTDDKGNQKDPDQIKQASNDGLNEFFNFINSTDKNEVLLKEENCQMVSCYYSKKVNDLISEFNETGQLHESFKPFADMFDELISKNGEKIPAEQAIENMSKVVLRAHCFGTLVTSELERYLHHKLAKLGYNDTECARILSAPTALFSSSPVSMDRQPQFFNIVAYANCADTLIPTVKNFPDYKEIAGLTDEDVASETKKIVTLQPEGKTNYQLTVCSSLDIPSDEELTEYAEKHGKDVETFIETVHKGHAFSAITNILKDSPFMKALQRTVKKGMKKAFSGVVQHYSLGRLNSAQKGLEKSKNVHSSHQLKIKHQFQQECAYYQKIATLYGARRA